ncbi:MAG: hypothetical protein DLM50_05850 [Candidatus Meridianibacter frigidus]|nr:MAG: hypothetical protein DLM50_05850 [Candidatus Eremiobacteraeota bacterium]
MMRLISGMAGCGKSTRLREVAARTGQIVYRTADGTFERFAFDLLRGFATDGQRELIDEVDASALFERAAEPLFKMEWADLIDSRIDPEVPGLRMPQRFLEAAFRLIRKLHDAGITPSSFLDLALKGAAGFYARPPNLAHPDLLYSTKDAYRNSLDVDASELQRQYRREVDLAKILERLYRSYLELLVERGCLTGTDAIVEAAEMLRSAGTLAAARAKFPSFFLDDAQELTAGGLRLLQALYGEKLDGVVLAGDSQSATGTFEGARPDRVFAVAAQREVCTEQHRVPLMIERAARHLLGNEPPATGLESGQLTLFRATTPRAEEAFIAEQVVDFLKDGADPRSIALLFRSVQNIRAYEEALWARNVDVQVAGDLNLFTVPDVLDALALLWNVYDPFAHDWLLRTLSGRLLGLSDATLVALCAEPENAQGVLFEEIESEPRGRWDRRRDVRLGWNVMRVEHGSNLTPQARDRIVGFRVLLEQWKEDRKRYGLAGLARKIFSEGLARVGDPETARATSQLRYLGRLVHRIELYGQQHQDATLGDFLEYVSARMNTNLEACEAQDDDNCVRILSIDAARGAEFDHVMLPNVRAGSFPRYYVPDAFLFSPSLGMIAKENVGDARAARTAKFSYYMFRAKTRDLYNQEERRAFVYGMRRTRKSCVVTASERPTRGVAAPEFLTELQAARIPGIVDISDRWNPSNAVWRAQ